MTTTAFRMYSAALAVCLVLPLQAQTPPAAGGPQTQNPTQPQGAGGRGAVAGPAPDFLKRPPVVAQTPEMEQQLLVLPEGYKAQLVLSDPTITDPVGVTFDGNGRMYVLEMRSYMLDADGSDSRKPISRISRHEDADGDGIYEKHTVFANNLVLPRIAYPLEDGALLVLETDNRDLMKYTDTDGDGVADKKEVFFPGYGRITNIEWQPGGMTWALDNWLYTTYNPYRLRIAPNGKVLREETDVNGGEWGTNQDNFGKVWFLDGAGGRPVNFQQPIVYGAFNVPDNFEPGFQEPWPVQPGLGDYQSGMGIVRPTDQTLARMTGVAGPEIFRGDRLPRDMVGDLFFGEPVGRIVRRAKVVVTDSVTQLRNAYPQSEFIRSTDPLFRPVNAANAPDGTLYVVDMYTGIIQEANFTRPGSYLRSKIEQYSLERLHNRGRIWRITYDGIERDRTVPRMYSETSAQLVGHLGHPNGWWRDTAQKLLVLRKDKSVVPTLEARVRTSTNQLERIHALWTLEGLESLSATLARTLMKDADPQVRIQAIRASETLYKVSPANRSLAADYLALTKDADPNVVIQAMLTINLLKVADGTQAIRALRQHPIRGVKEIATQILTPQSSIGQPASNDASVGYLNLTAEERRTLLRGEQTFRELCSTCHGADGKGATSGGVTGAPSLAPPLAGSPRVVGHRDYVINVLLHGLTGRIDGVDLNDGAVMVSMASNTDDWIADVANFVRNAFGNVGRPLITPAQVAAIRQATAGRRAPWTLPTLQATLPRQVTNTADWKISASHNQAAVQALASASGRWDSGVAQEPNMWFQIEVPQPTLLTEVQLDTTPAPNRGTAGLGGIAPVPARAGGGAAPVAGARAAAGAPAAAAAGAGGGARGGGGGAGRGGAAIAAPVGYSVQVSLDGTTWSAPVAQGAGTVPTTVISLKPVQARFVRVTQTGKAAGGEVWAIQQVRLYEAPKP